MQRIKTNIPLGISTATLTPVMALNPGKGSVFHVLVEMALGKMEGGTADAPMDIIIVADKSGSTSRPAGETGETILGVEKESLIQIVDSISNPNTRIGVVTFDDFCHDGDFIGMTPCDNAGKVMLRKFIDALSSRGSTDYMTGLSRVKQIMPAHDVSRKRVMIFTSDGENYGNNAAAIEFCNRLRESGVTIYVAGVQVEDKYKPTMDAMAGGQFRSVYTATDILDFFTDAQEISSAAVITNGTLNISVPNFVQSIEAFALATRNGELDYIAGEVDADNPRLARVRFNDLGADEKLAFYLSLRVTQPHNVVAEKPYSYGLLTVDGQVPSFGEEGEIGRDNVVVYYAATDTISDLKSRLGSGYINADVDAVIKAVVAARDLQAAGTASTTAEAEELVEKARQTIAFLPKDKKFGLDATVEIAAEKLGRDDLAGMSTAVRGGTTVFAKPRQKAKDFNN